MIVRVRNGLFHQEGPRFPPKTWSFFISQTLFMLCFCTIIYDSATMVFSSRTRSSGTRTLLPNLKTPGFSRVLNHRHYQKMFGLVIKKNPKGYKYSNNSDNISKQAHKNMTSKQLFNDFLHLVKQEDLLTLYFLVIISQALKRRYVAKPYTINKVSCLQIVDN